MPRPTRGDKAVRFRLGRNNTKGEVTQFVSSMGTTGTIMGCSRYLTEQNPAVTIVGCQPTDGSKIPGIRRWPQEHLPKIFEPARVDRVVDIAQQDAEDTMRRLALDAGVFVGVSAGGAEGRAGDRARRGGVHPLRPRRSVPLLGRV